MNPHDNLTKLILPGQGERITDIVAREGGMRFANTLTITCCGHEWTGEPTVVLKLADAHRRHAHADIPKRKRTRAQSDADGRANAAIATQKRMAAA